VKFPFLLETIIFPNILQPSKIPNTLEVLVVTLENNPSVSHNLISESEVGRPMRLVDTSLPCSFSTHLP